MADNSTQGGSDTIRDIDRAGIKTQVNVIDTGGATGERLLDRTAGQYMPAELIDIGATTGTISAVDASGIGTPTGSPVTGIPTNGSWVACAMGSGQASATFALTGTINFPNFLYFEKSFDATSGTTGNWFPMATYYQASQPSSSLVGILTTNPGAYTGDPSGATWVRARVIGGGATPSVGVVIRGSIAPFVTMNAAALQPGTANVGYVNLGTATSDPVVGGSITTQNLNPNTGTATAGSTVALTGLAGTAQVAIQVQGTYTGALSLQVSNDNTNWETVTLTSAITRTATGALSFNIASAATGNYEFNTGGARNVRVTALAGMTGTATVTVSASQATTLISIDAPIPGTSNVSIAGGTLPAVTTVSTVASVTSVAASTPAITTTTAATLSSAATTNATSVKASAGNLYSITVSNIGGAAAFFKLYNKASAPTVGTDVPVLTIAIPASGTVNVPFGAQGFRMATGIAFAITNLAADSDTTAVAAAQVKAMVAYI